MYRERERERETDRDRDRERDRERERVIYISKTHLCFSEIILKFKVSSSEGVDNRVSCKYNYCGRYIFLVSYNYSKKHFAC